MGVTDENEKLHEVLCANQPQWERALKKLKRLERYQRSINDEAGLLCRLQEVKKSGDRQYSALCPAHDDNQNSLSIGIGDDRKILLNCHAGCSTEDVVDAVGFEMKDLFPGASSLSKGSIDFETYDYVDEDGELLYQVCRSPTKTFRQRKSNGNGGWIYNIKGVRRVPYRLPELLAADKNTPVFIVEGEKDVERLRSFGLIATCNSGGAGKWLSEFNSFFCGRDLVLLPDNDSSGRDHSGKIAGQLQSIARSVKIIELPSLPPKGDVSDWLEDGNSKNDLLELVEGTEDWNEKISSRIVPFPTEILPAPLADYVQSAALSLVCDESYVIVPLLAALAAAIGNTHRIQLKKGWTEPSVLWTAIVGDSGTVKSPALDLARRYHERIQQIAFENYKEKLREYPRKKEQHDAELKEWKKSKVRDKLPPLAPEEPTCDRCLCSDTTIEALAPLLEKNSRGLLLVRDELAGWINSFDAYKGGGGTDVAHWLSIHGARPMTVDRKTGKPTFYVPRAAVSITGSIQPQSLALALGRIHFENGLVARLLFCFPPRPQRRWTEAEIPDALDQRIDNVFSGLFDLKFGNDENGDDVPTIIPLDDKARQKWIEFFNQHGAEQTVLNGDISAAWSKLEGYAARLALIIHLVRVVAGDKELRSPKLIDEISIGVGITLSRWFGNEAARIYSLIGGSENAEELDRIRQLLEYIRDKGGRVAVRDLKRGPRFYRENPETAEKALNDLVERGLGVWQVTKTNGRPRTDFVLGGIGDGDGTG